MVAEEEIATLPGSMSWTLAREAEVPFLYYSLASVGQNYPWETHHGGRKAGIPQRHVATARFLGTIGIPRPGTSPTLVLGGDAHPGETPVPEGDV